MGIGLIQHRDEMGDVWSGPTCRDLWFGGAVQNGEKEPYCETFAGFAYMLLRLAPGVGPKHPF